MGSLLPRVGFASSSVVSHDESRVHVSARPLDPVLLYSGSSRPLSILLLEYGISGQLERSSALAILLVAFIGVVTLLSQRLSTRLTASR